MKEKSTSTESASSVCYETMEAHARSRIQGWSQDFVEAEVTEFLGRGKSHPQARSSPRRTLNAPRLMRDVYDGKRFKDGMTVRTMIEPTGKTA